MEENLYEEILKEYDSFKLNADQFLIYSGQLDVSNGKRKRADEIDPKEMDARKAIEHSMELYPQVIKFKTLCDFYCNNSQNYGRVEEVKGLNEFTHVWTKHCETLVHGLEKKFFQKSMVDSFFK